MGQHIMRRQQYKLSYIICIACFLLFTIPKFSLIYVLKTLMSTFSIQPFNFQDAFRILKCHLFSFPYTLIINRTVNSLCPGKRVSQRYLLMELCLLLWGEWQQRRRAALLSVWEAKLWSRKCPVWAHPYFSPSALTNYSSLFQFAENTILISFM